MIDYLKYIAILSRLKKESLRLSKEYDNVENSYGGEEDHGHLSFLAQKQQELDCWIEYHKTAYLKAKADKLLVPMPDIKDHEMYFSYDFGGEEGSLDILTEKGIYSLRNLIREECKARREVAAFWFTITTGLIGAAIGLVSVVKA